MANILIPDLQPGATYAIQLRSNDGESVSEWNNIQYVQVAGYSGGPAVVTNLSWVVEGTSFIGSWDAVTHNVDGTEIKGQVRYEVVISNGTKAITYIETQPRFEFLYDRNREAFDGDPQATLTILVRAMNTANTKSPSAATATVSNPAPDSPTNVTFQEFSSQVVIKWESSPSDDVVAYIVYAGTSPSFVTNAGNIVWSGAGFTAVHHSNEYNTDFYYKVVAVDVFGTESPAVTVGPASPLGVAGSVDTTPPADPTGVTASAALNTDPSGQYTDLTVTWTGPTVASDSSLSAFNVRYGYDGTTWNYVKVPADQLSTKISRLVAGGNIHVQVQAEDFTANRSAWVVASGSPVAAPKDTTFTETPAQPTAAADTMRIQVTHNLQRTSLEGGGPLPSDLDYFEVYASTTSNFTPSASNMLGTMRANVVAVQTFDIPASGASGTTQTWYVLVRGVDKAGNKSPYSAAPTAASVGLISTANIGDAQITNAKIDTLAANKITAGSGLIADLTVKSKLTLGDASTTGAIETFGYVAGSTGARFDKNLIEINQGSIAAAALKIQNAPNILPPQYAGFEYTTGYYTTDNQVYNENITLSLTQADKKYESQSLDLSWTVAGATIYLANDVANWNVPVEPGDYIYSYYVKCTKASGSTQVQPRFKMDDASVITPALDTATVGGGWERKSGTFTVPSGVAQCLWYFTFPETSGAIRFDGMQIERKMGALTTPSPWKPPGSTIIEGGAIRTGIIEGNLIRAESITLENLKGKVITSEWMGSKFIVSNEFSTAETGRRWWVGPSQTDDLGNRIVTGGMKMFDDQGFAYIHFPDDGSESKFAGGVTATTLDVPGSAKLADTQLNKGKSFTLNKGTTAPTVGPTVSAVHETYTLKAVDANTALPTSYRFGTPTTPNWANCYGLHVDGTYIMTMEMRSKSMPFEEGSYLWIWDKTTKNCVRVVQYYRGSDDWRWIGITKVQDRYFTIHDTSPQTVDEIYPFTSPGTYTERYTTVRYYWTIGHSADGRILLAWMDGANTTAKWNINHLSLTNWTINTLQSTSTNSAFYDDPAGVVEGDFDYGSNRLVIANQSSTYARTFTGAVNSTPRTYASSEVWTTKSMTTTSAVGQRKMAGFTHDGSFFWSVDIGGTLTRYSNIKWTSGSSKMYVAVKWRNTTVNAETALGTASSIATFSKRQFLSVSHPGIQPGVNYPPDEPDSMGIYVVRSDTQPALTSPPFLWQVNTGANVGSYYFDTINESGTAAPGAVAFIAGSPSKIVSTDLDTSGNPLVDIRADGYGKLNQLIVDATTDANLDTGNKPALRVGNITGTHLRIDGNEIIAATGDTGTSPVPQGVLFLNDGGITRATTLRANNVTGGSLRDAAPYARLYRTSSGTWANNTKSTVPLVLDEETDSTFGDTANDRLVTPIAGIYMVIASVEWTAAAGGRRELSFFIDGVERAVQKFDSVTGVTGVTNQIYWMGRIAGGIAIRMDAYQNSGAGINMVGGVNSGTFLAARWMAP